MIDQQNKSNFNSIKLNLFKIKRKLTIFLHLQIKYTIFGFVIGAYVSSLLLLLLLTCVKNYQNWRCFFIGNRNTHLQEQIKLYAGFTPYKNNNNKLLLLLLFNYIFDVIEARNNEILKIETQIVCIILL